MQLVTPRPRSSHLRLSFLLGVALVAAASSSGGASEADWNQVGGPTRDFRAPAPSLSTQWSESGPKVLWTRDLGAGYSGISVVGDRLFTAFREGDDEILIAAKVEDGATIWQRRWPAPFAEYHRMEHGSGPHITPLVVNGRVFFAGIHGNLMALDAESGRVVWEKELVREMGGTEMDRGYACSPLAIGDRLIVSIGGEGQEIAALDQTTGEVVWSAGDDDSGYSSPTLIEIDGQPQILILGREGVDGLDPDSGKQLWSHPHPTSFGLNITVPIWNPDDGILFISSAYNGGSRALRLQQTESGTQVEELWAHKQMRIHIGNSIRVGDVAWGPSGDFGAVPFSGVNVKTGDIVHRTREIARAFHVFADGKLILLDEDGVLSLASPSKTGLEVHAQHQLFATKTWTPPTLVGRHLYARDQAKLVKLELP